MSSSDDEHHGEAMGSCLLSEANDLKRPLQIVAKELNVSLDLLECLLRGDLEVGAALDVMRKMSEAHAVSAIREDDHTMFAIISSTITMYIYVYIYI